MSARMGLIDVIARQSEDNGEEGAPAMLLTDWLAAGNTEATVFGKERTIAEVLAIAAQSGFDLKTGYARPNMEFGGAMQVTCKGQDLTLFWDEVSK